jgi:ribosomal protein L44E
MQVSRKRLVEKVLKKLALRIQAKQVEKTLERNIFRVGKIIPILKTFPPII